MKHSFLNYMELLKNNHFFLLLAVIISFFNVIIQVSLFIILTLLFGCDSFMEMFKNLFTGTLILISPFILVWIISFLEVKNPIKIKALDATVTFIFNGLIIIIQCLFGYFAIIFRMVF